MALEITLHTHKNLALRKYTYKKIMIMGSKGKYCHLVTKNVVLKSIL